jgi:hypothetical protein
MMSDWDREHIDKIMGGYGDWFGAQLLRLIAKADASNRHLLSLGFPDEVAAVERWMGVDTPVFM